jgi:uncharacterized protein (TIGR02453 family)
VEVFEGFSQATLDFLHNLRFNNNREWFEANKADFIRDFQNPMKALSREVFDKFNADFGGRGFINKVSRIYKDARRVKGGEPYRTNLWFSIEKPPQADTMWSNHPVFWFELSADNWSYGMGYYSARAETMAKLRARIDKNPKSFEKLIAPLEGQSEFILDGSEYARRKEAPTKKTEVWYNKKSFSLIHEAPHSEELFSQELTGRLYSGYAFLMPLYDYFITLEERE